jgi:hypothetical protein
MDTVRPALLAGVSPHISVLRRVPFPTLELSHLSRPSSIASHIAIILAGYSLFTACMC